MRAARPFFVTRKTTVIALAYTAGPSHLVKVQLQCLYATCWPHSSPFWCILQLIEEFLPGKEPLNLVQFDKSPRSASRRSAAQQTRRTRTLESKRLGRAYMGSHELKK
jgi:hypothetical protein